MSLLDVKDLRVEFSTQDGIVTAVNDLNFSLKQGETLGYCGRIRLRKITNRICHHGATRQKRQNHR